MEKMLVYLSSDHVIRQPSFGLKKEWLNLATNQAAALKGAKDPVSVLNAYYLDLDRLRVKAPGQEVLNGFEDYDVVLSPEGHGSVSICTDNGLKALEFSDALFAAR